MQLSAHRTTAALASAAVAVSVAAAAVTVSAAAAAPAADSSRTITKLRATSDGSVSRELPQWSSGARHLLVVRHTARAHKSAYLKFVVPEGLLHDGGQIESAVLSLKSPAGPKSKVSVRATNRAAWTESSLDFANAPRGGATIAALVRHSGRVSKADVTSFVKAAGTYTFQLSTGAGVSRFYSSESSVKVPKLTVTVRRPKPKPVPTTPVPTTPVPTTPVPPAPTTPVPPITPVPPAPSAPKALLGMSAPLQFWDARVSRGRLGVAGPPAVLHRSRRFDQQGADHL